MADDILSTVASVVTIASALYGLVQFVIVLLSWKRALDKLPSRLTNDLTSIGLLKALADYVEEHVDNANHSECARTQALGDYLLQYRASEESASRYVDYAGKQASHPGRYIRIVSSSRILWDGRLVAIESQLISHIHKLVEEMISLGQASTQSDDPSQLEGKQPSLQSSSTIMAQTNSKTRVIEHIPISLGLCTIEGRHRRQSTSTLTHHPRWLPSRGIKLAVHRSASGNITPSLRPYVVQPFECEIFSAVSGGDLDKTLRLFSTGQSSPFVRDENGCSLLHHASCSNNPLLCQRLIDFGLGDNVDEETPQGLTPGQLALLSAVWDRVKDRTFVNHLLSMLMRYSSNPHYAMSVKILLIGCCTGVPDLRKLSSLQNIAAPHLFKESKTYLLGIAKIYILASQPQRHPRPDVLKFLLGLSRADKLIEALKSAQGRGCLLHILAVGLIRYHRKSRPTFAGLPTSDEFDEDAEKWKNLCRALIRTSKQGELYHVDKFNLGDIMKGYSRTRPTEWIGSPLVSVLQALFLDDFAASDYQPCGNDAKPQHWHQSLFSTVRIWLEQIVAAGVDLHQYGQRERRLLAAQRYVNIGCLDFTMWSSSWSPQHRAFIEHSLPIRLVDFKHGRLVHEWRFFWEIDVEKLVGEFWHAVDLETSYPRPPGSWVE